MESERTGKTRRVAEAGADHNVQVGYMMKKHFNRKGFTMAEVLIVVAIIVVLASVGIIALFSHMRSMQQLEMDGQAKEIFIAAQNHLAVAESQGYLGMSAEEGQFGTVSTLTMDQPAEGGVSNVYYFLVSGASAFANDSVLTQMLPFASMDESARVSGSYIIRYQKNPGQILDVFYVDPHANHGYDYSFEEGDYETLFSNGYAEDREKRRSCGDDLKKGAVIGYYGGVPQSELPRGKQLLAPTVEIFNAEVLRITVTDNNTEKQAGNQVTLVIHGDTSGQDMQFSLSESTFEITLDDVTAAVNALSSANVGHFARYKASFIPGENLTVTATAFNNTLLTNIAESAPQKTNSLFAAYDAGTKTATITNIRHLLNLDARVSEVGAVVNGNRITVENAVQTGDLSWTAFTAYDKKSSSSITSTAGATGENKYLPVAHVSSLGEYDGGGFKITGVDVDCATNAGLFAKLDGCSVKNLTLMDFNIKTSNGNAGALAGEADGSKIESVLVYNSAVGGATAEALAGGDASLEIEGSAAVGGLVGLLGGSKNVETCAAAVYVESTGANGAAGGLIGALASGSSITIDSSYVGGHTESAKFVGLDAEETAVTRINILSNHGHAGGLVGDASNAALNLTYCYSTASVASKADTSVGVGGLVGNADGTLTASSCYSAGLATGEINTATKKPYASISPLVGDGDFASTSTDVEYLSSASPLATSPGYTFASAVTAGDTGRKMLPATNTDAVVYDRTLAFEYQGKFSFATVSQLGGKSVSGITNVHYGDWQMTTMEILNYTLTNSDTLFTDIIFKEHTRYVTVVLYGETSEEATAFLLQLADDQSSATVIDSGVLAGNDISWRGTPDTSIVVPDFNVDPDAKTLSITLDDITGNKDGEKRHFASVFPNLIPGENFTLFAAGGKCSWAELQTLRTKVYPDDMDNAGQIIALSDNSLFAKPENLASAAVDYEADSFKTLLKAMSNAEIRNVRHLQNLDTSTSNVNTGVTTADVTAGKAVTTAELMDSIDWSKEKWNGKDSPNGWNTRNVYRYNTTTCTAAGQFNGIYNANLTELHGNNKTIKGMVVGNTYGEGAGNAGLFRRVDNALTIEKLHLDSPALTAQRLSSTTYAGAFVAYSNGSLTLNTVLAEGSGSNVSASNGAAGGLVGSSNRNLTIENSAAAMYVTASGAAGGLVGEQTGSYTLEISNSYVGGHTYEGLYYVGTEAEDPDGHGRWNIISTNGASGGLLGLLGSEAGAKIDHCFNAASVYCGNLATYGAGGIIGVANGEIEATSGGQLNLVYVVAPVCSVKEIRETIDGLQPDVGKAGSIIGVSDHDIVGSSAERSGIFFLANVYTSPLPTMLESDGGSVSNIKTIGEGDLSNAKLAYYYAKPGRDNVILPFADDSLIAMEQMTKAFDGTLGEYPFAIWTQFAFEGSSINYYYGDWQPAEKGPSIHLDVKFYTVLEAGESDPTSVRTVKHLTERDQVIAVQIPYEPVSILLPWPEDVFGYDFGDWTLYYGDQSANIENGVAVAESAVSGDGSFTSAKNGTNVALSTAEFKKANQEIYCTTDESGQIHLHITLVSTYQPKEHKPYKLEFYDMQFKTNSEGVEEPDGHAAEPMTYQVLEPRPDEDRTQLSQLVEGKQPPTRAKAGYRFLGWYVKDGETYTAIYENTFNAEENSFKLVLNAANAGEITVDHDVKLYGRYAPIPYRTLTVRFMDNDGNEIPSVEAYQIQFEGDRGFKETVIPLPYEEGVLWPNTDVLPTVMPTGTDAVITWLLTGTAPTVTVEVPAVAEVTDANRQIECKVTYNVNAEYTGYAVLYEFMDTGADGSTYTAGQSYVYPISNFALIQEESYLYGATIKGFSPDIDVAEDARYANYMASLQPAGFEISGEKFVKQDNNGNLPEKYAGKYPAKVKNSSGEDMDVTCLVVIQCKRKVNWLTFDSDGGTIISPVKLTYGRKLSDIMMENGTYKADYIPTYASYTFTKWVYTENGVETDVTNNTTMPAHDLELRAKREGAPVKFTVLFMEQDVKDDREYTVGEFYTTYGTGTNKRDFMANAGSDVSVSVNKNDMEVTLSWTNGTAAQSWTYDVESIKQVYTYFNLKGSENGRTQYTTEVSDDGSTLVKVYLDRNYYSVWFLIGRATGGSIKKIHGEVDDETESHILTQYTRLNGTTFWAYEDEENGVPYGEDSGRYFELTKTTKDVPVYKPEGMYSPEPSPDAAEPLFGISGGYYVTLHKEGGYEVVATRTWNDRDNYYGLVNGEYIQLEFQNSGNNRKPGYIKDNEFVAYNQNSSRYNLANNNNGTQYGVVDGELKQLTYHYEWSWDTWSLEEYWTYDNNVIYEGDRYKKDNGGNLYFVEGAMRERLNKYVFTWKYGNTEYSWVLSDDSRQAGLNSANDNTIYGGSHFFSSTVWKDGSGNTYANNARYSRIDYPEDGEFYEAEDLEQVGDDYYYRDTNNALVETEDAGTKTVPEYRRQDNNAIYDHTVHPVYYLVVVDDHHTVNVEEFEATTSTKYYVSTYSGRDHLWQDRKQVDTAWNNNPFSGIPAQHLRLVSEKGTDGNNYTSFYYSVWGRYGAEIKNQWPDMIWLSSAEHHIGIMDIQNDNNKYKFTSWLFPNTSKYYQLHSGTMTSIKGPYATMSEELILQRNNGTSNTFFDDPDDPADGLGNEPSVILYGRYRPTPNWWNYVIHFARGGRNPSANPSTSNASLWDVENVHVYSDGPSGNQNPILFPGYECISGPSSATASTNSWKDINYYYVPHINRIHFYIKDNPDGTYRDISTAQDCYYFDTVLTGVADIYNDDVPVPQGYEFKGWRANPMDETNFDFSTTMPDGELFLYAVVEPVDKSVTFTLTKPEGCEADPVWVEGGSDDRTFTGIKHKSTLTATLAEDGRSFTPQLEGYRFAGWVEQEEPHTPFTPSQQILKNYTLVPTWDLLPEPVKINVTINYVEQDNPDHEVHASTTEEAVVDDSHKFTALNIDGYKPVKSYYYETIDSVWMEEHLVAGTTDSYAFTIEYVPSENNWDYTVEYRLYLTPVGGGTPIGIPITSGTQTSNSNFTSVSFFSLPEGLQGYKFHSLELYEGYKEGESAGTKVDSTTDPIIFVKKATGVRLIVNVVPDDSYFLKGDVVRTYNTKGQGVEEEFEDSLPALPEGAGFTRSISYRYYLGGRLVDGKPVNVGAYNVETEVTVAYNGTNYFFWKSASGTGSRPDVVLYIDRCDVILTSRNVTNMFLDNDENRRDKNLLPDGYQLVDIARDTHVDISGVSDDVLAKLNGANGLVISPSADSFRRAGSTGPDTYTLNVFVCEMSTAVENGNYNFYKTYGKIYLWKNLDAYNAWKAAQPAAGG